LNAVVGNYEQCKTNDFKKGQYAASAAITHSINKDLSPGWFWTSSPSVDGSGNAGSVVFVNGYVGDYNRTHGGNVNVRLVRSSLSSGSAAALEFDTEYAKLAQYQRLIDEVKAKEQAQRDAEEAQRKAQQARAAAVKSLLAQGPQGLYLQAGRAQRDGGGARINGEYFSAKQMYDLIVDNFPKSEFSVKASDQLNAMARGEVQERSEREARGRAWCEAELRRREASCNTAENPAGCVSYHRNSFRCD
jgi:Tfp pilus assembly protein PilN